MAAEELTRAQRAERLIVLAETTTWNTTLHAMLARELLEWGMAPNRFDDCGVMADGLRAALEDDRDRP